MKKNAFSSAAIFLLSIAFLFAQEKDPCNCDIALANGIYNERVARGEEDAISDIVSLMSEMDYETFKRENKKGGGVSIFNFGARAEVSEAEFNERKRYLNTMYARRGSQHSRNDVLERYGDKDVLNAWNNCKAKCNASGIQSWIFIKDSLNIFLHIRYQPSINSFAQVEESKIVNGAVNRNGLAKGIVLPEGTTIGPKEIKLAIKRQNLNEPILISIVLSNSNADVIEYIPSYVPIKRLDGENDDFSRGMFFKQSGQYSKSIKYLEKCAKSGNSHAAVHLGQIYYEGLGEIPMDKQKAMGLFEMSAKSGNSTGQFFYGHSLKIVKNDNIHASLWLREAAVDNFSEAHKFLARLRGEGILIPEKDSEYRIWLSESCRSGRKITCVELGVK